MGDASQAGWVIPKWAAGISLFAPRSITVPGNMDEISTLLQGLKDS